jgi:hypothetical protein
MKSLSLIALLLVAMHGIADGVQFLSAASSMSPDGRWKLSCKMPADSTTDAMAWVVLTRVGGKSIKLRQIDRHCEVLWSPDSSHFAIPGDCSSDRSDVLIYSASRRASKKSLAELFPTNAMPAGELNGHCYMEAREWLDPHRLRINIFGHTDDAPVHNFDREYIFNLRSGRFETPGIRQRSRHASVL